MRATARPPMTAKTPALAWTPAFSPTRARLVSAASGEVLVLLEAAAATETEEVVGRTTRVEGAARVTVVRALVVSRADEISEEVSTAEEETAEVVTTAEDRVTVAVPLAVVMVTVLVASVPEAAAVGFFSMSKGGENW